MRVYHLGSGLILFPISRDPPEGGTGYISVSFYVPDFEWAFPISRDPPEGGTGIARSFRSGSTTR